MAWSESLHPRDGHGRFAHKHNVAVRAAKAVGNSKIVRALTKERFTKAVPPGSFRDLAVRGAALASAAVLAPAVPGILIAGIYGNRQGDTWAMKRWGTLDLRSPRPAPLWKSKRRK